MRNAEWGMLKEHLNAPVSAFIIPPSAFLWASKSSTALTPRLPLLPDLRTIL